MQRPAPRAARRLACAVLAAGGSSRLGTPKQLVRIGGKPLLVRTLEAASLLPVMHPRIVVLGAQALRIRAALQRRGIAVRVVHNPCWPEGLATSLRAALAAVPRRAAALLVLLVDQPEVGPRELRRLTRAWQQRPAAAAAAHYDGRVGVPAILPRSSWPAIRGLRGDAGARALLRGAAVTSVPMPEAALDIDAPADLERLKR